MSRKRPKAPRFNWGGCTLELKIQTSDGVITNAIYIVHERQLAESVFESLQNTARRLSDTANELSATDSWKQLDCAKKLGA